MMRTHSALALLACIALASSASASPSGRIVEQKIGFAPASNIETDANGVPIVQPPTRVSGYFKLDRTVDAHMFYFLFESRNNAATDPVVLWMTGGPGCSSELAVFYENGPYAINDDMSLTETPFGWDVGHTTIFVDQPINTGFSYSNSDEDRVFNEILVADDMLDFLQEFFEVHPDLAERPFYVTGESYAGHYIPVVAHRVWAAAKAGEGKPIDLKGLAIGNGLTNPSIQFPAYADFALENKLIPQALHDIIQFWSPICTFASDVCESFQWDFLCGLGLGACMSTCFVPVLAVNPGINVYDIKKTCDGPLCYDFSNADEFLNMDSTKKALGVSKAMEWVACDMMVHQDLSGDWLRDYTHLIPDMLEDGLQVMIYAGTLDLICNWLGNSRWVHAMEWSGQAKFQAAKEQEWSGGDGPAGTVKAAGGLSFVKVFEAGHMVPMDQPKNALAMIAAFTRGKALGGLSPAAAANAPATWRAGLGSLLSAVAAQPAVECLAHEHHVAEEQGGAWGGEGKGKGQHHHTVSLPRGLGRDARA
ncbi:hypothetical protein FOA52_015984 [Chlamydomonas sp. UWO 241]|nr:hypothetical protein FOA52_015984 [Chlamydomonas sp. UWO 241]